MLYRPYSCPFGDLIRLVPEGAAVADVGCGSGMFLSLVLAARKPSRVLGLEISPRLIENARRLLSRAAQGSTPVTLEAFDGFSLAGRLDSYDVVCLIDVLHHVPAARQRELLREVQRSMRPGATLLFKEIDAGRRLLVLTNKLHDLVFSKEIGHERSRQYWESTLTECGFAVSQVIPRRVLWYPHVTMVATKVNDFDRADRSTALNTARPTSMRSAATGAHQ
jgi:SAM-dependent methyltransferase